jgi:hypothetical protein
VGRVPRRKVQIPLSPLSYSRKSGLRRSISPLDLSPDWYILARSGMAQRKRCAAGQPHPASPHFASVPWILETFPAFPRARPLETSA